MVVATVVANLVICTDRSRCFVGDKKTALSAVFLLRQ
jgi:hypothetical protein